MRRRKKKQPQNWPLESESPLSPAESRVKRRKRQIRSQMKQQDTDTSVLSKPNLMAFLRFIEEIARLYSYIWPYVTCICISLTIWQLVESEKCENG